MAGKPTRAVSPRAVTLTWARRKETVFRRLIALASTALITGALAGCGNTDSWVDAKAADGWPAQYGDAANSSYADVAGAGRSSWGESLGQG